MHLTGVVDELYGNANVTLCIGVVLCALIVFVRDLDACFTREVWGASCLLFLSSCLMYEDNPTLCFMLGAFVVNLAWARRLGAQDGGSSRRYSPARQG